MKSTEPRVEERPVDKGSCDLVEPPDFLRDKLVAGEGVDPDEVERRANAAIAAMRDDYLRQAHKDIGRIELALAKARSTSGPALGEALEETLWIAHEMRGQAGTFDYELVTTIGTEMCRYIEAAEAPEAVRHDALAVYADTMRAVIGGGITGDGGETGATLLAGMSARIARIVRLGGETGG